MSVKVMAAIFDRYPHGGGEMLLALALADHAHEDGTSVRPSVKLLAKKTRQSERTVQYQLRKMQAYGWLILVRISSGKPGDTNEYKINSAWLTGAKSDGCNFCTGAIDDIDGCNQQHGRVQNDAETGAIAVAPKPLLKPSIKPSINLPPTPQGGDEDDQDKIPASWTIDPRHRFAMPTDWQPTESTLAGYIAGKIAAADGKPLTVGRVMEILPRWREEANASANVMTDAQWTLRLVRYAMQYKDTTNSANAPKNSLPGGSSRYIEEPLDYPIAKPDENLHKGPVNRELAKQSFEKIKIELQDEGSPY